VTQALFSSGNDQRVWPQARLGHAGQHRGKLGVGQPGAFAHAPTHILHSLGWRKGTELEFVIMVIAVSCVKLLSAHNSTQHTSRKHKV
jgi:hypothetical protein